MSTTLLISSAQNLVPNPSFECGEDMCSYYQIPDMSGFSKYACGWSIPSLLGTSDILSSKVNPSCNTYQPYIGPWKDGYAVPIGSQTPRTGDRCAGIFIYSKGYDPNGVNYRENLQVMLKQNLIPNKKYCAEMYVSPAENQRYVCNNLGMYFAFGGIGLSTYAPLNLTPQILEKRIITDTVNWVKIEGTFSAPDSIRHLIIGNFFSDDETDAITTSESQSHYTAYYYIDDVAVEEYPNDAFIFAGKTIMCEKESVSLSASVGVDSVYWTTVEDTTRIINKGEIFNVSPQVTTSYRVYAKGCSKRVVDTITVTVNPRPKIYLGKDTTICVGSKLILDAGDGFASYVWQDQKGDRTYEVDLAGTYGVTAETAQGCSSSDSVNVSLEDKPVVDLGKDILVCDEIGILNGGSNSYEYLWSDGSKENEIKPTQPGRYWVQVLNQCGQSSDTINLYGKDDVFIPNVVTINDDGYNETFQIAVKDFVTGNLITDFINRPRLRIYNRWGNEVYVDEVYNNDWPATDLSLSSGEYYYYIQFSSCSAFKGFLQIVK